MINGVLVTSLIWREFVCSLVLVPFMIVGACKRLGGRIRFTSCDSLDM